MTSILFIVDGGEYARIRKAGDVPQPGHEVWFGRERYYVSDVPKWQVLRPSGMDPDGVMVVEIELTRLALRKDPK